MKMRAKFGLNTWCKEGEKREKKEPNLTPKTLKNLSKWRSKKRCEKWPGKGDPGNPSRRRSRVGGLARHWRGEPSWGPARDSPRSAGRPGDHLFSMYFLDKIFISFWRPFGCRWLQKWIQKPSKIPPKINKNPMRKSMPKKSWKLMKNRCENGLEIERKSV